MERSSRASTRTITLHLEHPSLRISNEFVFIGWLHPQPPELKKHHQVAVQKLREKLRPTLLQNVKGDDNKTLVPFPLLSQSVLIHLGRHVEHGRVRPSLQPGGVGSQQFRHHRSGRGGVHESLFSPSLTQSFRTWKCVPTASSAATMSTTRRRWAVRARRSVSTDTSR